MLLADGGTRKCPNEALIFWMGITNLVLAIVVIGAATVLAYTVGRKLSHKNKKAHSHELDAEVHALVHEHFAKGTAQTEELEAAHK